MKAIYPPTLDNIKFNERCFFLAGPMRCARNWQHEVILSLRKLKGGDDIVIASPSPACNDYNTQVDWETTYLHAAATTGIICFFLAEPIENDLEFSYARTTRFELGEWIGRAHENEDVHIIVGYEKKFPGLRYILKRIEMFHEAYYAGNKQIIVCSEGIKNFIQTIKTNI